MTSLIEVENIGKTYGSVIALSDVSTVVNAGEVTCVLGDNGAGKSTLIKILAGVHQHDQGSFKVEGNEIKFSSPREALDHGIATVYQDLAVVPLMSVWRNFFLGSEPTTKFGFLDRKKGKEITKKALSDMGIDLRDVEQPVGTLSGGERLRATLAALLLTEPTPQLLLLDEPTNNLDMESVRHLTEALSGHLGAMVVVSHDLPFLRAISPTRWLELRPDGLSEVDAP